MSDAHRDLLSARFVLWLRVLFAALAVVSLVLGYIGLHRYTGALTGPPKRLPPPGHGDLIYYDIELFLVQSTPLANGGPIPWALQTARFSAPCVSLYAAIELLIASSAGRIRRVRTRLNRGHIVVCGATHAAEVLVDRLRADGRRVVTVEPERRGRDARDVVIGDPSAIRTLVEAGADRADCVYACLDRSQANAEIVDTVERIRAGSGGRPLRIDALIDDLDLCIALKARRWSAAAPGQLTIDFFNLDELAAQSVVRRDEDAFRGGPPEIAVVGTGAFARCVLVEFARQWASRRAAGAGSMTATLIGDDARRAAAALRSRYAILDGVCRIEPRTDPLNRLLTGRQLAGAPPLRRVYLSQDDETEALKAALGCATYLRSGLGGVVVRLNRLSSMARAFQPQRPGGALLDALGGFLRVVDVAEEACDPGRIEGDWLETMARVCHQHYLVDQLGAGYPAGSTSAMVPWEWLSEDLREANRDQAADIGRKLALIGCLLTVRTGDEPLYAFGDGELDALARLEHERWTAERLRSGWRHGPDLDRASLRHPDLVPWARLSEPSRDKDRRAVLAIPEILADAGLAVVRIDPLEQPLAALAS